MFCFFTKLSFHSLAHLTVLSIYEPFRMPPFYQFIVFVLPFHHLVVSSFHQLTVSTFDRIIVSPVYRFTVPPFYRFTVSSFYRFACFAISPFFCSANLSFYPPTATLRYAGVREGPRARSERDHGEQLGPHHGQALPKAGARSAQHDTGPGESEISVFFFIHLVAAFSGAE